MLVNALTTDSELDRGESALCNPTSISDVVVGCEEHVGGSWGQLGIHVTDEITVASNGDGNALVVASGTVDGLGNDFHGEVGVALVHRLEEGYFRVTGEVNILGTVQCCVLTDELWSGQLLISSPVFTGAGLYLKGHLRFPHTHLVSERSPCFYIRNIKG